MAIEKSIGQTRTERFLAELCDRTFLKLWCYPNPFKADGKELCDVLAVFENHVFLFFDRESRKFDAIDKDIGLTWDRWKREAVDKQIKTAAGAKSYIERFRDRIYLDSKCTTPFPLTIPPGELHIHKIVVAHGAKEACERFSAQNVSGSLGICYGESNDPISFPFIVSLDKRDPVHLLDSHTLDIVLAALDTLPDFNAFLDAKEKAIRELDFLIYCGEEDLLAHYFCNYHADTKAHYIGVADKMLNGVFIGEGEWQEFVNSAPYRRRKAENEISYVWDELIQRTAQNALLGTLLGNGSVFQGRSAIHEMAKEPRVARRALSNMIGTAIKNFPDQTKGIMRQVSFLPSIDKERGCVFLQLFHPNIVDYDNDYRPKRRAILEAACGAAKNKFPHLKQVVGIGIDSPKHSDINSEDFILMPCATWTEEQRGHYEEANRDLRFFQTDALQIRRVRVQDFPTKAGRLRSSKIGRNETCPCGSGKKYKHCHGRQPP